jgi:hypothetical protein
VFERESITFVLEDLEADKRVDALICLKKKTDLASRSGTCKSDGPFPLLHILGIPSE